MSDKFGEGRDPYLYPGLDIMRNRLNIRQQQRLEQAAYEMTALRAATIELGPLVRGLPHLRTIHRQLYQDIFDWAGQLREVDIYQGDTPFCHFAYIEKEGNALMQDLEEEGYLVGLEKAKFVERLAHYYCEINAVSLPGGKWFGTADLLRATGDSCRISTELAGYRKRGLESGKSEWGNGGSHRAADDI